MNFLATISPGWVIMSLDEQLSRVNYVGLDRIETFLYFGPTNDTEFLFDNSDEMRVRIQQTKKQISTAGLQLKTYHSQYGPLFSLIAFDSEGRADALDNIKNQITVAKLLGASTMVIHGGSGPAGQYTDRRKERLDLLKNNLLELAVEAEKQDIKLAVENMIPNIICADVCELVEVIDQVPSKYIGICFDTGHANLNGDVYQALKICGDRLAHIHLHDNNKDRDAHAFPFTISLDEDKFFTTLRDINFNANITIEVTLNCDKETLERYRDKIQGFKDKYC